jgi:hypothetical protein
MDPHESHLPMATAKHVDLTLIQQASVLYVIEIQYVGIFPAAALGLSDRVATFGW